MEKWKKLLFHKHTYRPWTAKNREGWNSPSGNIKNVEMDDDRIYDVYIKNISGKPTM